MLAFSLLLWQIWLPWSVPDFVTEDGPSHPYTAVIARNLLLHHSSEYSKVYELNPHIVPNWGSALVLGVISAVFGTGHAEQVFSTLALAIGFLAFGYAVRSFSSDAPRWTPLVNFLLQTWFLWLGFYNFYLGMVLCPFVIGYYVRRAGKLTIGSSAAIACLMAALFFTHLIPAVVAGITIVSMAACISLPDLFAVELTSRRASIRNLSLIALAMTPALILFGLFSWTAGQPIDLKGAFTYGWEIFPMHVFTTSSGRAGNQFLLFPAVLCLIALAIFGMKRLDWRTARGGLAIGTLVCFLLYLFAPDAGLGGKEAKIRFIWAIFILGGLLFTTAPQFKSLQTPFSIYASILLAGTFVSTQQTLWKYTDAVEDYLQATRGITPGARLIRLRYPTPDIPARYGFSEIGRDPLFHLDSFIAARCSCLDLTDYQAPNAVFPILFNESVAEPQRWALWSFENPGQDAGGILTWLRSSLAADYVILIADAATPGADGAAFDAVLKQLNSEMRLVGTAGDPPFVRVYRSRSAATPATSN